MKKESKEKMNFNKQEENNNEYYNPPEFINDKMTHLERIVKRNKKETIKMKFLSE